MEKGAWHQQLTGLHFGVFDHLSVWDTSTQTYDPVTVSGGGWQEARVEAIENKADVAAADIDTLEDRQDNLLLPLIQANTASATTLTGDLATLSGTVTTLTGTVSALSGTVTGIQNDLNTISTAVSQLAAALNSTEAGVLALGVDVADNTDAIAALTTTVANLPPPTLIFGQMGGNLDAYGRFLSVSGRTNDQYIFTSSERTRVPVPYTGTLVQLTYLCSAGDSADSVLTIRKTGSFSTSVPLTNLTSLQGCTESLSITVSAGDYLEVSQASGTFCRGTSVRLTQQPT